MFIISIIQLNNKEGGKEGRDKGDNNTIQYNTIQYNTIQYNSRTISMRFFTRK